MGSVGHRQRTLPIGNLILANILIHNTYDIWILIQWQINNKSRHYEA